MAVTKEEVKKRLQEYLAAQIPGAQGLVVERLDQILGGASRITYFLGYRFYRADGEHSRRAVLRMMPETGGFTSDNIAKEVQIFKALKGTKVPAPHALYWSDESRWLGSPFVIVEEVDGCESSLESFSREPYLSVRKKVGENFWTMLGELAQLDPVALGLIEAKSVVPLEDAWRLEMEYVDYRRSQGRCYSDPVIEMLIRWLKKNPPPAPAKLSIVHGDYRSGNFLYDESGAIRLMLDWELWRVGDPAFDLVYSIQPNFQDSEGNAGRLIPVADAIATWEKTTGFKVPEKSVLWYEAAFHAGGMAMMSGMRNEYFDSEGRESLGYFYSLASFTVAWPRLRQILSLPEPSLKQLPHSEGGSGERMPEFLNLAAKRYLTEYQRTITDANTARTLAIDAMTLKIVADRFENSANNYVEDNREIEGLLHDAVGTFASGNLLRDIDAVLEERAASFRISDLVRRNDRLCEVLIALHAAVEENGTEEVQHLEGRIRQVISNHGERSALSYNPFLGL